MKSKYVWLILLYFSTTLCMHRMQSPLAQIRRALHTHAINQAKIITAAKRLDMQTLMRKAQDDPHIRDNDWYRLPPLLYNLVLKEGKFNLLNPAEIPYAVDAAHALVHHMAPEHLKKHYPLTNYADGKQWPNVAVNDHETELYEKVLKFEIYSNCKLVGIWPRYKYFPKKAPGVDHRQLRKFIDYARGNVCDISCISCDETAQKIERSFSVFNELIQLPAQASLPTSCVFGLIS